MERNWFARAFTMLMCISMSFLFCILMVKNLLRKNNLLPIVLVSCTSQRASHTHFTLSHCHKFPKPMFRKHHAHFQFPKVKVATIKLLHDFQGLHLKRRHFEHKTHNKHSLKILKALEEIFDTFET